MITFWVDADGSSLLRGYSAGRGREIAGLFDIRHYDDLTPTLRVAGGAQIFSALDLLTPGQTEAVTALWEAHARLWPSAVRLNDPRRVLRRFDLLTSLHAAGLNAFRVYRAADAAAVQRYPVFVRQSDAHGGLVSALLRSADEVQRSLRAFQARGYGLAELMIAEFCDTSDSAGVFRKYAAYKVGDRIIPCHIMTSREWVVRSETNELEEAGVREEIDYLARDPHQAWLRRVFDIAGVGYGRVDYGVANGEPQAWEINLNPTIGRGAGQGHHTALASELKILKEEGRQVFHRQLREAFAALDRLGNQGEERVGLPPAIVACARAEVRGRRRRATRLRWLETLYVHPLARPLRAAFKRLFPNPQKSSLNPS